MYIKNCDLDECLDLNIVRCMKLTIKIRRNQFFATLDIKSCKRIQFLSILG